MENCAFAGVTSSGRMSLKLTLFPGEGMIFEIIDNAALISAALFTAHYTKKK